MNLTQTYNEVQIEIMDKITSIREWVVNVQIKCN